MHSRTAFQAGHRLVLIGNGIEAAHIEINNSANQVKASNGAATWKTYPIRHRRVEASNATVGALDGLPRQVNRRRS